MPDQLASTLQNEYQVVLAHVQQFPDSTLAQIASALGLEESEVEVVLLTLEALDLIFGVREAGRPITWRPHPQPWLL